MQTMRRIRQIAVCLLVFSILTFFADIVLTLAGASLGWYYGVGLCFTALTVFRALSPTGGNTQATSTYRTPFTDATR
jgi:hypothetical protein